MLNLYAEISYKEWNETSVRLQLISSVGMHFDTDNSNNWQMHWFGPVFLY